MTKTKIPALESLIKVHKFDWVNNNITEKLFPAPAMMRIDFKLYHFDRNISSEEAIQEMEEDGYAPANIYELLSWKDWDGKTWVVALGSVGKVVGFRDVPGLGENDSLRGLYLSRWGGDWHSYYRFLAVRNSSLGISESRIVALGSLDTLSLESRVKSLEDDMEKIRKFLII